ncbi:MAG: hypothetical protein JL56_16640 [Desulfotomaculum sp. BICA1-6]|nr:MAG: hypothetical protein JL56_16640 [Desulfotomaculum sp. BICA1-6]
MAEKLKQEYEIEEEWVGYELHPETPPEGKLLRQMFPNYDPTTMILNLNRAGAPYGITFSPLEVVANTRLALEAGEFAREAGLFEQAHERLLRAYFQEGENIGEKETLLRLLGEIGLNRQALGEALDNGTYATRLQQARAWAREHDVTALPTFIIEGKDKIIGAKPYEAFKRLLDAHV